MKALKVGVAAGGYLATGAAMAQMMPGAGGYGSNAIASGIASGLCSFIAPFVGSSPMVSLLFVVGLAVILLLWMLNENKEGVIVWLLRSGIVVGVLVNIFTLPTLIGLPSPCAGFVL